LRALCCFVWQFCITLEIMHYFRNYALFATY
jgi:hypothetical protein